MQRRFVTLALILSVGLANRARAEDWPQFRGPTGQGHSAAKNLPVKWSATENVDWNIEIPGKGWSSPIVLGGRVYLTAAVARPNGEAGDQSLRAICLDAKSGKFLWNVEVFDQKGADGDRIHRKNSHASPTPVTDGKHLYVHYGTKGTACLTLDGKLVWGTQELVYVPRHGSGGSPIVFDDLLIVSCDGADVAFVVALDKQTGKIRWKTERPSVVNPRKFSFSTPLVIDVEGRKQVVCPGTDVVIAYEPKSGREIWTVEYDGYSVVPRPVYGHGLIYMCTGWSPPKLLAIRPTGKGNVTGTHVQWRLNRGAPNSSSVLLVGDELYFVSDRGVASCVDAKTGELHWQERLGGGFSASPLFADGKIYFQNEQGETTVIKPGKRYLELARNQLGAKTLASFAVADSALLIRTETQLLRISSPAR